MKGVIVKEKHKKERNFVHFVFIPSCRQVDSSSMSFLFSPHPQNNGSFSPLWEPG